MMECQVTIRRDHAHPFSLSSHTSLEELNPKEMLLYAALSCSAYTIDALLSKRHTRVEELELSLSGRLNSEELRAESVFESFMITYRATCPSLEDQAGVAQMIRLSHDKYCGLLQMLRKIAPLSHEISICS